MSQFALPPAYDPKPVEEKWYSRWEEAGLFHAEPKAGRRPFCITIPPPNVNGELHMGHALQHCIHDSLARWHRMNGDAVLVVPGTDHASIATNRAVELALLKEGASRQEIGREAFLRRCWEWTHRVSGTIMRQLKLLGCSYDWNWGEQWTKSLGEKWIGRFTMDAGYCRAVAEAFVRFHKKGWIYRGARVINWCPQCQSTVSDLEVDHAPTNGHLWHIRYPFADGEGGIIVATTRPETMLGDTAVAVNAADERYQSVIGKQVILPLMNRPIPIIGDDTGYVDPAFGSGAVKVTPAHDLSDFEAGMRHDLPSIVVIGLDGCMTPEAGPYAGLDRYEARKRVVEDLRAGGFLVKIEDYAYSLGRHDRCDTIIEPLLSEQWFVAMKELAQMTIQAIEGETPRVHFIPDRFRDYSLDWLANIRDWNISRQIWWGHRLPVYYCQKCGETIVSVEPPERCPCGGAVEQDPDTLDTWFSSALWPFAVLGWPDQTEFKKNKDNGLYPTSVLITDRGIVNLWVLRMIMTSLEFVHDIPFRDVLVHPTVMDAQGRRMSKSLGTGIDPVELINQYGTDATRFGILYQCASVQDMRFSEERILMSRNFGNKIWNASRLVLSSIAEAGLSAADLEAVPARVEKNGGFAERWILGRLDKTIRETREDLERYRFDEAARGLQEFFWGEFCDWYLEIAKAEIAQCKGGPVPPTRNSEDAGDSGLPSPLSCHRQIRRGEMGEGQGEGAPPPYSSPTKGGGNGPYDERTVEGTMAFVLETTLRLLHPFMPFITEEIWQTLPHDGDYIMTAQYPSAALPQSADAEAETGRLMALVTAIRRMRADRKVAPKEWINLEIITADKGIEQLVKSSGGLLSQLARSKQIEIAKAPTLPGPPDHIGSADLDVAKAHAALAEGQMTAEIYLSREATAETIKAELARLQKSLQQAQTELQRAEQNLANADFISRAPTQVVEKMRTRRSHFQAEIESLTQSIARLEKENPDSPARQKTTMPV